MKRRSLNRRSEGQGWFLGLQLDNSKDGVCHHLRWAAVDGAGFGGGYKFNFVYFAFRMFSRCSNGDVGWTYKFKMWDRNLGCHINLAFTDIQMRL